MHRAPCLLANFDNYLSHVTFTPFGVTLYKFSCKYKNYLCSYIASFNLVQRN